MKMKYLLLTLVFLVSISGTALYAQPNELYYKMMAENLQLMGSATTMQNQQKVINKFERIAAVNPDEWLPLYYAGLMYTNLNWADSLTDNERDELLDKAGTLAKRAEQIAPDESEIIALEGYVLMARLSVKPGERGMVLTPKVNKKFNDALELNPDNPRALFLKASMEMGTANFFGTTSQSACVLLSKSLEIFEKEKETDRGILPNWGKDNAQELLPSCKF